MSKVLLIDDEEPIRKILGMYLHSKGYEVITAADGQEGIELFQCMLYNLLDTDFSNILAR